MARFLDENRGRSALYGAPLDLDPSHVRNRLVESGVEVVLGGGAELFERAADNRQVALEPGCTDVAELPGVDGMKRRLPQSCLLEREAECGLRSCRRVDADDDHSRCLFLAVHRLLLGLCVDNHCQSPLVCVDVLESVFRARVCTGLREGDRGVNDPLCLGIVLLPLRVAQREPVA